MPMFDREGDLTMWLSRKLRTTAVGFSFHRVEIANLWFQQPGFFFFFCTLVILLVNANVHKYVFFSFFLFKEKKNHKICHQQNWRVIVGHSSWWLKEKNVMRILILPVRVSGGSEWHLAASRLHAETLESVCLTFRSAAPAAELRTAAVNNRLPLGALPRAWRRWRSCVQPFCTQRRSSPLRPGPTRPTQTTRRP